MNWIFYSLNAFLWDKLKMPLPFSRPETFAFWARQYTYCRISMGNSYARLSGLGQPVLGIVSKDFPTTFKNLIKLVKAARSSGYDLLLLDLIYVFMCCRLGHDIWLVLVQTCWVKFMSTLLERQQSPGKNPWHNIEETTLRETSLKQGPILFWMTLDTVVINHYSIQLSKSKQLCHMTVFTITIAVPWHMSTVSKLSRLL